MVISIGANMDREMLFINLINSSFLFINKHSITIEKKLIEKILLWNNIKSMKVCKEMKKVRPMNFQTWMA